MPIANDMQLGISANNSGLYRNNSNASYPYDIGSAISITASSASTAPQDYYYFFYNIEVEATCSNIVMPVYGCTDSTAINYSVLANTDDGSCCYIAGCTDPFAINYNSNACIDDSSCTDAILGCVNPLALNYNSIANTNIAYGGVLDSAFGTGGYFTGDQHLIFDANQICIIKSSDIYSFANNTINFQLRDDNGLVIDDTVLTVVPGYQRINLNFNVPIGNSMQLGVSSGALSNSGLFRTNSGAVYPFNIGSAITISGSSASTPGYYYFFYNIEIEAQCIDQSWDCDGQGNCYDPGNGNGQYMTLNSCELECQNVSINELNNERFNLYPNPAKSKCTITSSNLVRQIRLFDISSRICLEIQPNKTKISLDLKDFSDGVYIIELITDNEIFKSHLIIE